MTPQFGSPRRMTVVAIDAGPMPLSYFMPAMELTTQMTHPSRLPSVMASAVAWAASGLGQSLTWPRKATLKRSGWPNQLMLSWATISWKLNWLPSGILSSSALPNHWTQTLGWVCSPNGGKTTMVGTSTNVSHRLCCGTTISPPASLLTLDTSLFGCVRTPDKEHRREYDDRFPPKRQSQTPKKPAFGRLSSSFTFGVMKINPTSPIRASRDK